MTSERERERPPPREPCSGSGGRGAGPRRRMASQPPLRQRLGRAVEPSRAGTQAQPGLPARGAVPVPPPPPRSPRPSARAHHPPEGVSRRTSPVPGPTRLRDARPGEREPGQHWSPSHPETSANLGVPGWESGHGAGPGPASQALRGCPFVLPAEPENLPAPHQPSLGRERHFRRGEAWPGGSGSPAPRGVRGALAQTGKAPLQGLQPQAQAAQPGHVQHSNQCQPCA